MRLVLHHSLASVRPVTPLSRLEHKNDDQRREDDEKGYGAGQRSKRIDIRLRHGRRQPLQLERQGVDGSDRLAGAREFVPGQGKAEQTNAHDGRQYDWQHHMAKCLPWCCTEVARRLFSRPSNRLKIANMIKRPNGKVQVRCAPRPEVKSPIAVVQPSAPLLMMKSSSNRNSSAMPSEVMIDGMIRLAMAT